MHDQSRTHTDAADDAPRCVSCHSGIPAWDTPRFACDGCQQRTAQRLGELPSLYAALNPAPGRGAPLVGSRHGAAGSRAPLNLAVVDLTATASRDAVLPRLVSWVRDWADVGHLEPSAWPLDDAERVAACCNSLRWHLDWASREHLAIDDFMDEIRDMHGRLYALATGDRGERPVMLACPCGGKVPFRLSGERFRCGACGERYGRVEVCNLPPAQRAAA
jgi:predicted RNA-binding Zn-ribbon protein involved in translation (DUF1610 family)